MITISDAEIEAVLDHLVPILPSFLSAQASRETQIRAREAQRVKAIQIVLAVKHASECEGSDDR